MKRTLFMVVWGVLGGCVASTDSVGLLEGAETPQIVSQDDALAMLKAAFAVEMEKMVEANVQLRAELALVKMEIGKLIEANLHAEATVKGVETHKDITYGAGDVWTSRIWAIGATAGMPVALWFGWKLKCRQNKHGSTGGGPRLVP